MVNVAILKIVLWIVSVVFSGAIASLNKSWTPNIPTILDFCGKTVGQGQRGGFLVFNSFHLPADYRYECRVVIMPDPTESSSTHGNYMLFHFSDFEVGKHCEDTNITILDGNGINMNPIEGLRNPMCGANSTLTKDVTFRTRSFFMTLIFRRNEAGLNFKSKFNLTFLSFSEGPCGADNQQLFTCNNSRCIDKKFVCQNLNPCGDNSDCSKAEVSWEDIENLLTLFKYGLIATGAFFALFVLYKMKKPIKSCCHCLGDCADAICDNCSEIEWSCCRRLAGGVLDTCRRWKSNGGREARDPSQSSSESAVNTGCDSPHLDLRRPRYYDAPYTSQGMLRPRSEPSLNNSIGLFHALPRASGTDDGASMYSEFAEFIDEIESESETGENEHVPPSYRENTASVPSLPSPISRIEIENETGNDEHAPPSYREVTASAPPMSSPISLIEREIETRNDDQAPPSYLEVTASESHLSPSTSTETTAPPTYDDVIANESRYIKRN